MAGLAVFSRAEKSDFPANYFLIFYRRTKQVVFSESVDFLRIEK